MQNTTHICIACRQVARACAATVCPFCGSLMKNMGMRWQAPKKRDGVAWTKLELMEMLRGNLVRLCTCYDYTSVRNIPGPRASLAEYKRWIRRRREHGLWNIPQSHKYNRV